MKKRFAGAGVLTLVMALAGHAAAQTTGSQEVEAVVITTARNVLPNIEGVIVAEQAAKSRATITADFIMTQPAGQSILNSINLLPGVNYTNSDAYGSSGGNLRIRSFDGPRISLTLDGMPMNDTGNYAIYGAQQIDPEIIDKATVNLGATDVDSPTASATGGTVSYTTRRPANEFGGFVQGSIGTENFRRVFGLIDSGKIGPWGATVFATGSYTKYDKFKGPGGMEKLQFNGGFFQPLGGTDFVRVSFHWNKNRNNFYRNLTLAQIAFYGDDYDNLATCTRLAAGAGVRQDEGAAPAGAGTFMTANDNPANPSSCTNYYNLRLNPSNTGNIRGSSRFTINDALTLTVDPSFQYTLANGGGYSLLNENDPILRGASAPSPGVDLNGDGDVLDRIALYSPNNTNTRRYGITSSLIWNINDAQRVRVSYTFDYGRHRQTGEWTALDAAGNPMSPFGGKDGHGPRVVTADGSFVRFRDRFSIAKLNQAAFQYVGDFFEDKFRIDVGVRPPFFVRDLNNYCNTTTTGFAYCTTVPPLPPAADGAVSFPNPQSSVGSGRMTPPFKTTRKYDKILPNAGLTYRPAENHQIYFSFAQGLSAPRTDNLYAFAIPTVQPETTLSYDLGYRYQKGGILASTALWKTKYQHRIVSSFDQALGISIDRDVGTVDLWGWDGQIGFKPVENFTVYATASYINSKVQKDFPLSATVVVPTAGKQLVETPTWQTGMRFQYEVAGFTFGLQSKYVGHRFSTDANDEQSPGYMLWDGDIRYDLGRFGFGGSYLQLNASNLTDEHYLGNISSTPNATGPSARAPTYSIGAPRSVMLTLRGAF